MHALWKQSCFFFFSDKARMLSGPFYKTWNNIDNQSVPALRPIRLLMVLVMYTHRVYKFTVLKSYSRILISRHILDIILYTFISFETVFRIKSNSFHNKMYRKKYEKTACWSLAMIYVHARVITEMLKLYLAITFAHAYKNIRFQQTARHFPSPKKIQKEALYVYIEFSFLRAR